MKIIKQYQLPYSRQAVYDAWVAEDKVVDPVSRIVSSPQEGGQYTLYVGEGDQQQIMNGTFKQVIPGQRLTYSWNWQGSPEETLVNVAFKDSNSGSVIDLIHEGFQFEESQSIHDQGWDSYVNGLSKLLEEQDTDQS